MTTPFITYADNFEDVVLWRALGDVERGFYLDVGAGEPRLRSVTHAFYQRGWRGINLEPASALQRRLRMERPADVNLAVAAAASAGEQTLYEVSGTTASTFDARAAEAFSGAGHEVLLRRVPLDTLDAICAQHAEPVIHFVRIDAGQGGAAVLEGFDLARWRPWVVLLVGSADDERLRAAGYRRALSDGHTTYYAAPGRDELLAALALPPTPSDRFVLCEEHRCNFPLDPWRERVATAEASVEEARTWAMAHVREWKEKYGRVTEAQERARRAEAELATMAQYAPRAAHADVVERELAQVYASLSWRITRPLREGRVFVARARGWLRRRAGQARALGVRIAKALLRRAMHVVLAQPRLASFARRQIVRFPRLTALARGIMLRGRLDAAAVPEQPITADASQLPDSAQRVLRDLQRARR